ncbi:hypothetical protein ID871_32725 [Streptomyces pratensis]|nr:hypothetical protein [Streptomyces pratensis]
MVLLPAVLVIAVLVIRVGITELRSPGSARQQWRFLANGPAAGAGIFALLLTAGAGWFFSSAGVLFWGVLVGLLVAFIVDRSAQRP